jgi:hypothetical protein
MTTKAAPAPILTDITNADPAEIDGHLARLGAEAAGLGDRLYDLREALAAKRADKIVRRVFSGKTEAELEEMIRDTQIRQAEVAHLMYPLETEFDRRPWSRYYLVEDGHLHYDVSGSRCSRIPSTTHYWMTEFSGMPAKMVIAKAQERVCTMCFPDAPVSPRKPHPRFMTMTEAEKAAHAEAADRKAAAKKAAQITTPEGGALIVGDRDDHIKTERAAWNRAMADAATLAFYGEKNADDERAVIEACLEALAHRRGVTVESLRVELNKKIAAKARREDFTVMATA